MENSFCFMMVAVATMLAAACSINDNCHRHQSTYVSRHIL